MVLLIFLCVFCLFIGLEKKYRTKRKEILGVEMGLHCSCFQFRVSVFIHDCTNRYFTYRELEIKSSLTFVGKPKGKRKNPWGGSGFFTAAAFPFEFRDLCCINYCKFALGDSQYETYFFLTLIVKKNR